MEQAERGTGARSQNVVHFVPRTTDALTRVLAPALERIDVSDAALQVLVVTPDAETAVVAAEVILAAQGALGIEVVPVTSANRAARLLEDRPVHAVAGPAIELQTLVQRSALKLEGVRSVILAWIDDEGSAAPGATGALESLMGEVPRDASRTLIARRSTPDVEQLVERYLRTARRVAAPGPGDSGPAAPAGLPVPIQFLLVSPASRPAALRRLLDELDPPSAAVLVRDSALQADAVQTVRSLGYRRASDPVRVARYDSIPESHTIILYDAPVLPSDLAGLASSGAVQIVALLTPRDAAPLQELAGDLTPLVLEGPSAAARSRDAVLREELRQILAQGTASRELIALEPLLELYDGTEIAAAAVRLLELERANRAAQTGGAGRHGLRLVRPELTTDAARERPDRGQRSGAPRQHQTDRRGHTGDREGRNAPDRGASHASHASQHPQHSRPHPRPPKGDWSHRGTAGPSEGGPPRRGGAEQGGGSPSDRRDRRERDLGRGPRSDAHRRDRRNPQRGSAPGRPSGPPRPPRPPRPSDT